MINDYLWTTLYAQREAQLRAHARRRGGAPASSGATRPSLGRRFLLRLRRGAAQPAPATTAAVRAATVTARLVFPTPGVRTTAARATTTTERVHEEKAA